MIGNPQERERLVRAASLLREAERPVRVLRSIAWEPEVRERFFERGATELPEPTYTPLDPSSTLEIVAQVRAMIDGDSPVHRFIERAAESIADGARMLASVGTVDFHRYSRQLYGAPDQVLTDGRSTSLDLARQLDEVLGGFTNAEVVESSVEIPVEELAESLRRAVTRYLGADAPRVEIVDHLSANALAGPNRILLRRGARFTDRDLHQLAHHEAFIHVATTLNGRTPEQFPLLSCGHPGITRTQEGLAVFAEFISGAMDPDRLARLADRVLAIQMAIEGADFLQLYRFFLERTSSREQAFENARRVVRGGVLTGGAPFTKDGVYLDGLLRVHNYLRCVVQLHRIDCLKMLFAGKIDLQDIPAVCMLAQEGLAVRPRYMPPWAADLRFLVCYLAYSSFLNRIGMVKVRAHYEQLLAEAPIVTP